MFSLLPSSGRKGLTLKFDSRKSCKAIFYWRYFVCQNQKEIPEFLQVFFLRPTVKLISPPNPQLLYGLGKKSHRTPLIVLMFLSKNIISGNIKNIKKLQKEKARNHFGRRYSRSNFPKVLLESNFSFVMHIMNGFCLFYALFPNE